jgi:hypothetical protein
MIVWVVFVLVYVVICVVIAIWVAKDARARGSDAGPIWILVMLGTGILGLLIYLLARPTGQLMVCPNCGNQRLAVGRSCPHCGVRFKRTTAIID